MKNLLESLESRRLMTTFTVTNALDSGAGSLRWAIDQTNASADADVIRFAIGSGAVTIPLASTLTINQPVTIDATTQPGYAGSPMVRLDNAGTATSGLYVNAAGSVVRGLSITNMGTAANVNDGTAISVVKQNIVIEKCYIGLTPAGIAARNENDGIGIGVDGDGAIIRDNVIGGNLGDGIQAYGDNVVIQGNKIGTDPTGALARGNAGHGVHNFGVVGLLVGGDLAAQGNVISANGISGVYFANLNAKGSIFNNKIGVAASGNAKLANGTWGIHLIATTGVVVGDYTKGNHIGGNGITITGNGHSNVIRYNTIGVAANGSADVGDTYGIDLNTAFDSDVRYNTVGRCVTGIRVNGNDNYFYGNYVGTTDAGANVGNTTGFAINGSWNRLLVNSVASNSSVGIHVQTGDQNGIDNNRAWANGQSMKVNAGANSDFLIPEITSVTQNVNTGEWTVNTFMDIPEGLRYTLSYYVSDYAGHPASGHIQKWLGSLSHIGSQAYEPNTRTFPAGTLMDGKYLTVTLSKAYLNNGVVSIGATSQPTAAKLLVGLPSVHASSFDCETIHAWNYTFSDDVSASLNAGDLSIVRSDGTVFSATSVTWNAATKTARWTRSTPLPDGAYTAKIKTTAVSNTFGQNVENFPLPFKFLRGDANRDGTVNFDDLLTLAQNYGTSGKTFSQGNFNYDAGGQVNFDDLLLLAQRYGSSVFSALPILATPSATGRSTRGSAFAELPEMA